MHHVEIKSKELILCNNHLASITAYLPALHNLCKEDLFTRVTYVGQVLADSWPQFDEIFRGGTKFRS